MEQKAEYLTETNPTELMAMLLQVLKPHQLHLLARLMMELKDCTGYGNVKIFVKDDRVLSMTCEKSHDAR